MLSREDGRVRWHESAQEIYNRFRGVYAWPGSFSYFKGQEIKIKALKVLNINSKAEAGTILAIENEGIWVATGEGVLLLEEVQPSSKRGMGARAWANGYQVKPGDRFKEKAEDVAY
ncbi:MAG: hypothetical protein R2865_16475 [Deinococcales bacterium]